jgi:hypothetical protein
MSEPTSGQSGGIDNQFGTIGTSGGDVVGGNKTTTTTYYAPTEIHAWQPVADAIRTALDALEIANSCGGGGFWHVFETSVSR